MKKFLSLVMALVMTMSLVTIGAGAKDFTDNSKINYKEAVDVMASIKIIDGNADGSFRPANTLTRGAASKIICNLILGPTTAAALGADTAPYKDVPANSMYAGYVAYCSQQGIINGYADGTFRPAGTVTGYQFMKMLLVALGYDGASESFTGPNWSVQVAKLAISLGLNKGNDAFNGAVAMTREEACLYAFNTLKTAMVEYDSKSTITVNGVTVATGASKAKKVAQIDKDKLGDKAYQQFGETYFKDLKLAADAADAFGRPANTWTNKSNTIGTYARVADATYTKTATSGTVYADLGLTRGMAAASVTTYVNGVAAVSAPILKGDISSSNEVGKNGSLTQVYYDADAGTAVVTVVDTFIGKVTATYAATASKDAFVRIEAKNGGSVSDYTTDMGFKVDDMVLYTYSGKTGDAGVKSMATAEFVTGTLSGYTVGKAITVAGTAYKSNGVAGSKSAINDTLANAMKTDVTVYLDSTGYAIYVDAAAASDNYAVVLGYTGSNAVGNMGDRTVSLLFADATTKTVTVTGDTTFAAVDATVADGAINTMDIVSYRITSDGKYKLDVLADTVARAGAAGAAGAVTTKGSSALGASLVSNKVGSPSVANYANGKTVVLVKNGNSYSTYKGMANMPSISITSGTAKVTAYSVSGVAKVIFIDKTANTTITSTSRDVVFIKGNGTGISQDVDLNGYYKYDAIINGEITTILTNGSVTKMSLVTGMGKDSKNVYDVVGATVVNSENTGSISISLGEGMKYIPGTAAGNSTEKAVNGSIVLGSAAYVYASDCKVFTVAENGDLAISSVSAITADDDDNVWFKMTGGELTTIVVETVNPGSGAPGVVTGDTLTLVGSTFTYGYTAGNGAPTVITVRAALMKYVAANLGYTWNAAFDRITGVSPTYTATIDGIVYTVNVALIP